MVVGAATAANAASEPAGGGVRRSPPSLPGTWPDRGRSSRALPRLLSTAPGGVCVTEDGTIVWSDPAECRVRLWQPTGEVTEIGGAPGFADGVGDAARFRRPLGVAALPGGGIVVADADNHAVRLISPEGSVTTLAGGANGFGDGEGRAARFRYPGAVCVRSDRTVVVADSVNDRIRAIDGQGRVTTLAGDSYGGPEVEDGPVLLRRPEAVACGPDGAIYVADTGNHRILVLEASGATRPLVANGSSKEGPRRPAGLRWPTSLLVLDDQTVLFAEAARSGLFEVSSSGSLRSYGGEPDWHPLSLTRFEDGVLIAERRWAAAVPAGRLRVEYRP